MANRAGSFSHQCKIIKETERTFISSKTLFSYLQENIEDKCVLNTYCDTISFCVPFKDEQKSLLYNL